MGQEISLTFSLVDKTNQLPIIEAALLVNATSAYEKPEAIGEYYWTGIFTDSIHLVAQHIGFQTLDTVLKWPIQHKSIFTLKTRIQSIGEVDINGTKGKRSHEEYSNIDKISSGLGGLESTLKQISALRIQKSGSGVARPIVQGQSGQRLVLVNNQNSLSNQNWGADHAIEIDPLSVDNIELLNGIEALKYKNGQLGNTIVFKPQLSNQLTVKKTTQVYGMQLNSNGQGIHLFTKIERKTKRIHWRLQSSLRRNGDQKTRSYFLRNTGQLNGNVSGLAAITLSKKTNLNFQLATFSSTIGILKGAHISNVADLEMALSQSKPFYTKPDFSYEISNPRQKTNHYTFSAQLDHTFKKNNKVSLNYAFQLNERQEYDVRRGDRSHLPSMALEKATHTTDLKWTKSIKKNYTFSLGSQWTLTENTNDPLTQILPLIPDFLNSDLGAYALLHRFTKNWKWEAGLRYDYSDRQVLRFSDDFPRRVIRENDQFGNLNTIIGATYYQPKSKFTLSQFISASNRNPDVFELFSAGLHQGTGSIELGNQDLKQEKSVKFTQSLALKSGKKMQWKIDGFVQTYSNYIYIKDQNEIRQTIRGAFPVFQYEQGHALFYGIDIANSFHLSKHINLRTTVNSVVNRLNDQKNQIPFSPPTRVSMKLSYTSLPTEKAFRLTSSFQYTWVDKVQKSTEADFLNRTPSAYRLADFSIGLEHDKNDKKWLLKLDIDNLFNIQYRDVLNRMHLFADETGVNATLKLLYFIN